MTLPVYNQAKNFLSFAQAKKNVNAFQEKLLLSILKKNKNTQYGKKHSFDKITSLKEYQEKIPLTTYEDILPYITKIENGQQNILTKDKVIFFATTSGTTKKTKLIPVTKQRMISFKNELSLFGLKFLRATPKKVLAGKLLYFAGPYEEFKTSSGIQCGSISGYFVKNLPLLLQQKLALPSKIYNEMDFEKKQKEIALTALRKNITQIGFAFPVEILMFFDYLKNNKEDLLKELEKRGHRKQVKKLKKINFTPQKLWPNLLIIHCITSAPNKPYLEKIKEQLPHIQINDPGIFASEGNISMRFEQGKPYGILPATTNVYEFIDTSTKKIHLAGDLKENQTYEVIMTTQEGLYRYKVGDIIKIVGFEKTIPLIEFYQRENYLNIAGELAYEKILIETMQESLKENNLELRAYTFTPYKFIEGKKPRYNILIEPYEKLSSQQAKNLLETIEKNLQENISDYKQMRREFGRLNSPILSIIKKGSYDSFDKKRLMKGGQQKTITISTLPEFIDHFTLEEEIQ